jgi:hypothetical protein
MSKLFLQLLLIASSAAWFYGCSKTAIKQPLHEDKPFVQDYSIKYYADTTRLNLLEAYADRNGVIQILTNQGLQHPFHGAFLYPGSIEADNTYRFMKFKKITAIGIYNRQLVYLSDSVIFSNAWAGTLFSKHALPAARLFAGGKDFTFLVSDGKSLQRIKDSKNLYTGTLPDDEVLAIRYEDNNDRFWILGRKTLYTLTADNKLIKAFSGAGFTAFDLTDSGSRIIIGTTDGYIEFDPAAKKQIGTTIKRLPATNITAVEEINGKVWFGSREGAFALRADGKFDYYNGERWLPGNQVVHISEGPEHTVLILTTAGLAKIAFKEMTLYDKAVYYEEQVRSRHIRDGFNASLDGLQNGNLSVGYMADSDNDGLWTSMYLGAETFRYAATKDSAALQNCRESLDALERLYTVNPVPGFPARSFERSGHIESLADTERWQHAPEKEWDWKSTTSSDEIIGHVFAFGAIAELIDDKPMRTKAIMLLDTLMSHILKNDMYLIDFDGQPTKWGKWNPKYVNSFPVNVGDRKLNSSNIISMLQTAYYFTSFRAYEQIRLL